MRTLPTPSPRSFPVLHNCNHGAAPVSHPVQVSGEEARVISAQGSNCLTPDWLTVASDAFSEAFDSMETGKFEREET